MTTRQKVVKRTFDVIVSVMGLIIFSWLIALCWLFASFETRQNGFFTQQRVGRYGRIFRLIKIRTMRKSTGEETTVTTASDPRITVTGQLFRKTKLDELPQLINVLIGHMSLVGPRPDVPGYADALIGDDRILLSVRPGITGPATLKYRDEEKILAAEPDPEAYNREVIYPDKVRINVEYVQNYAFREDLKIIWRTVFG